MTQFVVSLLSPIIIVSLSISFVMSGAILSSSEHHLCHPQEALSLLQFKQEMLHINSSSPSFCDYSGQGSYPKMIFWNRSSADCCIWDGVTCHEFTGFVIGLDISCSRLEGVIHHNSSLFRLPQLHKLNLAYNYFDGSEISPNFGGLSSLTHLNLSFSGFQGIIPSKLSHLSKLVLLDLSNIHLRFDSPRDFHILLQNLTRIRVLSLRYVNISATLPANWSSSLTYLNLEETGVHGRIPQGKHLTTFMNDSYYGNPGLCGFPMAKDCGEMDPPSVPSKGPYQDDDDDSSFWSEFTWKSVCIGYGFGFVLGSLVFLTSKPKWLVKNVEELCWYGLLLLGKTKMCKQLVKKSRRTGPNHYRSNNQLRK